MFQDLYYGWKNQLFNPYSPEDFNWDLIDDAFLRRPDDVSSKIISNNNKRK